jgi:hypothetical protein
LKLRRGCTVFFIKEEGDGKFKESGRSSGRKLLTPEPVDDMVIIKAFQWAT